MKSIANHLFLFTAAALSLGTVAYGQTALKADVPFAFRAAGGSVAAGRYTVRLESHGSGSIVHITNNETRHSVLSISYPLDRKDKGDIAPRLVFRCAGEAGCQISEIWTRDGGVSLPVKRVRDREYIASIPLVAAGD